MSYSLPQTIGIDISKASLDCHAHPAGTERQFANTAKGCKALIFWLQQWPIERIAYEATGTYHRALEAALADWPCVKLNPERARRFAQAIGTLARTDRIDAMLLARMAATLQPPIRPTRSTQQAEMADSSMPATAWCVIGPRSRIERRTSRSPSSSASADSDLNKSTGMSRRSMPKSPA